MAIDLPRVPLTIPTILELSISRLVFRLFYRSYAGGKCMGHLKHDFHRTKVVSLRCKASHSIDLGRRTHEYFSAMLRIDPEIQFVSFSPMKSCRPITPALNQKSIHHPSSAMHCTPVIGTPWRRNSHDRSPILAQAVGTYCCCYCYIHQHHDFQAHHRKDYTYC